MYIINFENVYYTTNEFEFRLVLDYLQYRDLHKYLLITDTTLTFKGGSTPEEVFKTLDGIVSALSISNGECALSMGDESIMSEWNSGIGNQLNFIGHRADFFAKRGQYEPAIASLRTLLIGLARFNSMVREIDRQRNVEGGEPSR